MSSAATQGLTDPRIPAPDAVSQAERTFIIDWVANEWRVAGAPFVAPDFVARQGRHVRLVDIREMDVVPFQRADMGDAVAHLPGAHNANLLDLHRALPSSHAPGYARLAPPAQGTGGNA